MTVAERVLLERAGRQQGLLATKCAALDLATFVLYTRLRDGAVSVVDGLAEAEHLSSAYAELPPDLTSKSAYALSALSALRYWDSAETAQVARRATLASWIAFGQLLAQDGDVFAARAIFSVIGCDAEIYGWDTIATRARHEEALIATRDADWPAARILFRRVRRLARRTGDKHAEYRARIGEANILWLRGNLPAAADRLAVIAADARRKVPSVVPTAMLMQAGVTHAKGDHLGAVLLAADALKYADGIEIRLRILTELASLLSEFPDTIVTEAARRALAYVHGHSPDASVRNHAALALMSLAIAERNYVECTQWKRMLDGALLHQRHQVYYHLYTAQALRLFGGNERPEVHLHEAMRLAERYEIAQLRFAVEAELASIASDKPSPSVMLATDRKPGDVGRMRNVANELVDYLAAVLTS